MVIKNKIFGREPGPGARGQLAAGQGGPKCLYIYTHMYCIYMCVYIYIGIMGDYRVPARGCTRNILRNARTG